MYSRSAHLYDAIHSFLNRESHVSDVHELIQQHKRSEGNKLLDVACGTGADLAVFRERYEYTVEGLDLDENMLKAASKRLSGVPLHHADMADFDLGREFDVVTCLSSSIGYVLTVEKLRQAIFCMARHLVTGGVLIIEPWISLDKWEERHVGVQFVDQPELKIARIDTGERRNHIRILTFHYLVGTPNGVQYFTERHETGLFTVDDHMDVFKAAGFKAS